MIHESYCILKKKGDSDSLEGDHYGPCAPTEAEYFVINDSGEVVWRQPYPSGMDEVNREIRVKAKEACIQAAFSLGFMPRKRIHSYYTDVVEWEIKVREEGEKLVLSLPMGEFWIPARRAKKGEWTSEVGVFFEGNTAGFGTPAQADQDALPVTLDGRVVHNTDKTGYWLQPSSISYEDGTNSGFLGSYPRDLYPFNDQKSAAAQLGAKGGAAKTEAKKKTAAENGKKGGRPKKPVID